MNEQGKLSLRVKYQVINVGGVTELENHDFASVMVIISSAVNHH